MIIFKFNGKEFTFSGFNAEAYVEDGRLFINGDMNDDQFTVELPSIPNKIFSKNNKGVSVTFDLANGDSYSAYHDDGVAESSVEISLIEVDSIAKGSFKGKLIGEDPSKPSEIEGNFSIQL